MHAGHTPERLTVERWDSSQHESRHPRALPVTNRLTRRGSANSYARRIMMVSRRYGKPARCPRLRLRLRVLPRVRSGRAELRPAAVAGTGAAYGLLSRARRTARCG